jgi:hypothetical protein
MAPACFLTNNDSRHVASTSSYTLAFKRSGDLSPRECEQIRDLFGRVFGKERSPDYFQRKYRDAPLGGAYHALCLDGDSIIAASTALPYRYRYFGKETVFALRVDVMVDAKYRGSPFRVKKMAQLVDDALVRDGIPFVFGFPNLNAWEYERRVIQTRDIGELDYYVLPRNIGALLASARPLNRVSRLASHVLAHWPARRSPAAWDAPIEKIADAAFESHRYDGSYRTLSLEGGATCTYRTYQEEGGARATYLVDVAPLGPWSFAQAVSRVYREAASATDVLLYVGHLPFRPARMLRVPVSRRPQQVRMTGKILIPELIDQRVFSLENWNVNLSNFDVR